MVFDINQVYRASTYYVIGAVQKRQQLGIKHFEELL